MEKFYFCNFLESSMSRKAKSGVKRVEVSEELSENVQMSEAYIVGDESDSVLKFVPEGEVCEGTRFDFIGTFNAEDKKVKSTAEELANTDENPLIIVATKCFKVFRGIPTYIKYVPVRGGVLVALVKGCISVMGVDGDMIPLVRNYSGSTSDKGVLFGAEEMANLNALTDKESDVPYSDYVVNDCIIHLDTGKDGKSVSSYKFSRDHFTYLYKGIFDKAKAEKEERIRLEKEEVERKKEERAKALIEERRRREREAEEAKELEAKKAVSKKSKSNKSKDEGIVQTGFDGASSFLDYVNSIKKGN